MRKMNLRRYLAGFFGFVMMFSVITFEPAMATPDAGFDDVGRMVAAEGIVLIQNPDLKDSYPDKDANIIDKVLPIESGETISVFGRTQLHYYNSGTGSGGDVKMQGYDEDNILAGLRGNPKVRINEALLNTYKNWVADPNNAYNSNALGGWNPTPFGQKEMQISDADAQNAAAISDAAMVIIGRTAGEDHDMPATSHDTNQAQMGFELNNREKTMIENVYNAFDRVVIVLNCANIMDMSWAANYPDAAIIYTWAGGQKGGYAIADVITGDITPSGKLSDTIAENLKAYYPNGTTPDGKVQFGSAGGSNVYYGEDIYVGYRYFETFTQAYDKVLYPFGYGLSYTTFSITPGSVSIDGGHISVPVTVKNTGLMKGKEVVQVYYSAPQGALGNPAKELAAFAKTKVLEPGEETVMQLKFRINDMASYNESQSRYEMLKGAYKIFVGNCVREGAKWPEAMCDVVYTYNISETVQLEQLDKVMPPTLAFDRIRPVGEPDANGTYAISSEPVPITTAAINNSTIVERRNAALAGLDFSWNPAYKDNTLLDVYKGTITMDQYVRGLSNEELSSIVITPGMSPTHVPAGGSAASFGGVSAELRTSGVPLGTMTDGPSGIRLQSSGNNVDGVNYNYLTRYATNFASGTAIACTWNLELTEKLAEHCAKEMLNNLIDVILGPGLNIHRYVLNGRNFEYFSEDPLLTGAMGAAFVRGVQSQGVAPTIKHFAANNQETGRHTISSNVSERALREIYLKSFQIAVQDGKARSVMTSYNPINRIWAASNFDLATTVLRKEWGFDGIVMTDWGAVMNENSSDTTSSSGDVVFMVRSQNDLYTVVEGVSSGNPIPTGRYNQLLTNIDGTGNMAIKRDELGRSAKNLLQFLMTTPAFARLNKVDFDTDYKNSAIASQLKYTPAAPEACSFYVTGDIANGDPFITGIKVGERAIAGTFNKLKLDYNVYLSDFMAANGYPVVTATPEAGTTVKVIQATAKTPVATIIASSGGNERVYKVTLTPKGDPILEGSIPAQLTEIKINGLTDLPGFSPTKLNYSINWSEAVPPTLVVKPGEGSIIASEAIDNGNGTYTVTINPVTDTFTIIVESADARADYTIRLAKAPKSDDFNASELSGFWTVGAENKENWTLNKAPGSLRVTAEYGDIYQKAGNAMKNYFYQYAYGDWEAVAKFKLNHLPSQQFNGFGLMVFQDLDNYVWLDYEYNNTSAAIGGRVVGIVEETNGVYNAVERFTQGTNPAELQNAVGTSTTIYMKMVKEGNKYSGSVSTDGVNYTKFASKESAFADPKLAITVYNGTDSVQPSLFYADVDYIHVVPAECDGTVTDINAKTTLKIGELEPYAMSAAPPYNTVVSGDTDGGLAYVSSANGEMTSFKINVAEAGTYDLIARVRTNTDNPASQIGVGVAFGDVTVGSFNPNATDSQWVTKTIPGVNLEAGETTFNLTFTTAGTLFNTIQFVKNNANLNTSALQAAIASVPDDADTYTEESWIALTNMLTEANEILADPVSQKQIDLAAADLLTAISKLAAKPFVPKNVVPDTETRVENGKFIVRVRASKFPWIRAQSSDFRYEGSNPNYNAGYITTGDIFYAGYMDLTGVEEIKLNYANGNTSTNQYQPSVKTDFYTDLNVTGEVSKGSTHSASTLAYDNVYKGGSFTLGNQFAGINFLHKKAASWTTYGNASTRGNINDAGTHTGMTNYWEIGVKTFITPSKATGMRNVYMHLQEGGFNVRYIEFIYTAVNVSFDLGYEGAPAMPALGLAKGTAFGGRLPEPTREDYIFDGWKNEEGYTITASTVISADTKLTAQWVPVPKPVLALTKTGDAVTLTANVDTSKLPAGIANVILAAYNEDGKLIAVVNDSITIGDSLVTKTLSIPLEFIPGAVNAKGFLWDSETYAPLLSQENLTF